MAKIQITEEQFKNVLKTLACESVIPWNTTPEIGRRTNLILLYDHEQQRDLFLIKNPSQNDIDTLAKLKYNDKKTPCAYCLNKGFFFVNLDNLIEINYDDEDWELHEYFYTLKDFLKQCYMRLTFDNNDPGCSLAYDTCSEKDNYSAHDRALSKFINNEQSPIQYFYVLNRRYEESEERVADRKKEIEESLKSFKTFVDKVKTMYTGSYCDCDSGWANLFIDLHKEKVLWGPTGKRKTNVHFIKSFKEYEKEWEKMMKIHHAKRKKQLKREGYDELIKLDYGNDKKKNGGAK